MLQTDFADADAYLEDIEIAGSIVAPDCLRSPSGATGTHQYAVCVQDLDVTSLTIGASATVVVSSTAGVDSHPYLGTSYVYARTQVCDTPGKLFPSQVRGWVCGRGGRARAWCMLDAGERSWLVLALALLGGVVDEVVGCTTDADAQVRRLCCGVRVCVCVCACVALRCVAGCARPRASSPSLAATCPFELPATLRSWLPRTRVCRQEAPRLST